MMPITTRRLALPIPGLERTGGSTGDATGPDDSFPPIERWRLSMTPK